MLIGLIKISDKILWAQNLCIIFF